MHPTEDRDLLIAWSLLPYVTPVRVRLLLEYFQPLSAAARAPASLLQGLLSVTPEQAAELKDPPRAAACDAVALCDEDYPPLLREIIDPPLALHVRGDRSLLARNAIAIVGSRRASPYALNASSHLARELARAGLVIVSGLARGVDGAAHTAALESSAPTIGVLGTGIDVVYPKHHTRLFRDMERGGLIATEFPPGTPPKPEHFPIRNRVISGLTLGAVIVEATARSGSLITARTAAEQNREVFAVPGSIFARGSEGTHRLIQYGAKLVHEVNDVLEELRLPTVTREKAPQPVESPLREVLEAFTRDEATHVDAAAARLRKPAAALAESLLQLELGGWLKALPGARFVRVK